MIKTSNNELLPELSCPRSRKHASAQKLPGIICHADAVMNHDSSEAVAQRRLQQNYHNPRQNVLTGKAGNPEIRVGGWVPSNESTATHDIRSNLTSHTEIGAHQIESFRNFRSTSSLERLPLQSSAEKARQRSFKTPKCSLLSNRQL